jgi:hypothetical protein
MSWAEKGAAAELEAEIDEGRQAALALAEHASAMGAAQSTHSILTTAGELYEVTATLVSSVIN